MSSKRTKKNGTFGLRKIHGDSQQTRPKVKSHNRADNKKSEVPVGMACGIEKCV